MERPSPDVCGLDGAEASAVSCPAFHVSQLPNARTMASGAAIEFIGISPFVAQVRWYVAEKGCVAGPGKQELASRTKIRNAGYFAPSASSSAFSLISPDVTLSFFSQVL